MTPARFRWGIILIQIGILILLRNMGVLNDNFWGELLIYFPVVLIAIGIEKIFTKSRLQLIAYLSSVAIFVIGLAIAFNVGQGGFEQSFFSQTTFRQEFDPEVRQMKAVLKLDHTDLTIRDSGRDLAYGRFDKFTRKPKIDYTVSGDSARLEFNSRSGRFFGGAINIQTGDPQSWYLRFNDQVPLDLECYGEDSDIHLNLATSRLERVKLDADNAMVYLKLGDLMPKVTVDISGEDTELKLRVPEGIGLKIHGEDYRAYLERLGLTEAEAEAGLFVNDGIDTLGTVIEIELDDRLSSFILDFF
ncbi:MAG: hypothetical protein KAU36_04015 [candidate division Zixibacteria bacterium]|nr:hypothetical protein [candidate division Zixibacteria bacterium]